MRVTAKLWVRDENFAGFETFEAAAFVILAKLRDASIAKTEVPIDDA